MQCSTCGNQIPASTSLCPFCNPYTTQPITYIPSTLPKNSPTLAKPTEIVHSLEKTIETSLLLPKTHPQRPHLLRFLLIGTLLIILIFVSADIIFFKNVHIAKQPTPTTQQPVPAIVMRNPYPPYTGQLVYKDPLMDNTVSQQNSYHWATNNDNHQANFPGHCKFLQQSYHLILSSNDLKAFLYCSEMNTNLSDFTYQVQMTILSGNYAGLTFRVSNKGIYFFYIGRDGSYTFALYHGGDPTIIAQGSSDAILTGLNETNMLAIVAKKNKIDLYVNNQSLQSITDNSLTTGFIGMVVLQKGDNQVEAAFSNIRVWN